MSDVKTEVIEYTEGDTILKGFVAYPTSNKQAPGVLVVHAFAGRSEFFDKKAIELAKLGYVGFAVDIYGNGILGHSLEENFALMKPFTEDRGLLLKRTKAGLAALQNLARVDKSNIAAIGYCFGGLAVLDMARANIPVRGVISYHGTLSPPPEGAFDMSGNIKPSVLICHGYDDPLIPPEKTIEACEELKGRDADYYFISYGRAKHAFTEPDASKFGLPAVAYDRNADERSWAETIYFLNELFGSA